MPYFAVGMLVFASLYPGESLAEKHRTWLLERAADSEQEDSGNADSGNADSGNADSGNADSGNGESGRLDPEKAGGADERPESRGPRTGNEGVSDYLRAEQRLGRVAAGVDPDTAARFLLNACYQQAHTTRVMGQNLLAPPPASFADAVIGAMLWRA